MIHERNFLEYRSIRYVYYFCFVPIYHVAMPTLLVIYVFNRCLVGISQVQALQS